jgi:hypothetical protein
MTATFNKVVIATWNDAQNNTVEIVKSINAHSFTTIDSTDSGMFQNSIKSQNIFFDQVEAGIKSLDGEQYLTFISGDVSTISWDRYIKHVDDLLRNLKPWVYSPYLTFEGYPREVSSIGDYEGHSGIDYGCITDGIVFSLHRDLALELFKFMTFARMSAQFQVGWGLDWIWCTLTIYSGKAILRDSQIALLHPKTTSYDSALALEEFRVIQELFFEFAAKEKYDLIKIRKIQYSINERIKGNKKYFTLDKFYSGSILQ